MTIPQAITELEDRGVPEVIALLERLAVELQAKDTMIEDLQKQQFGPF